MIIILKNQYTYFNALFCTVAKKSFWNLSLFNKGDSLHQTKENR